MRLPPAQREFPRAWAEVPLHCAASSSSPLPSLTGFSTLSSLYLPLVSLPAYANPTPLIHFLLTKTRFYWLRIPPWQNKEHLFPSDLSFCCALSFLPSLPGPVLIRVKVCGDRFYPAALILNMGMPHWQPPGSSIYNIYNTSWCSDTHT